MARRLVHTALGLPCLVALCTALSFAHIAGTWCAAWVAFSVALVALVVVFIPVLFCYQRRALPFGSPLGSVRHFCAVFGRPTAGSPFRVAPLGGHACTFMSSWSSSVLGSPSGRPFDGTPHPVHTFLLHATYFSGLSCDLLGGLPGRLVVPRAPRWLPLACSTSPFVSSCVVSPWCCPDSCSYRTCFT